jgi:hypothetical protein
MTEEEKLAAAIRPIIKNTGNPQPEPEIVPIPSKPKVVVVNQDILPKHKIVRRSQYMRDMLTVE